MLPKKNRISKEDFPTPQMRGFPNKLIRVLDVKSPLFSAVIYKNDTNTGVSVVVSKKTAKMAVVRNRIRRRVYSSMRAYCKNLKYPALIVFYPKKEVSTVLFSELRKEVEEVLNKAKLT